MYEFSTAWAYQAVFGIIVDSYCAPWFLAVLKKTYGADYEQLLRAVFSCFQGQKKIASPLKSYIINKIFDPENMKKTPSKVAHNRPPTFFSCTGPAAQMAQKQKSCTTKSPLMQDWVFRLGQLPIYFVLFGKLPS